MLSPLVSWIIKSSYSSSSSSSSEEEEEDDYSLDNVEDHDDENVGENEHFPSQTPHELPSTSTANDTKTTPTAETETESNKRRRISRRQYQRLWTKQDEIELLNGYLGYIKYNRWGPTSLQDDVTYMYDRIRRKLNADFNKNQVAQKLRSLKRKHKMVLDRFHSSGVVSHRNIREEAIFEISQKIWGKNRDRESSDDDDDSDVNSHGYGNLNENMELKKLIEETMKSCLSPLDDMNGEEGSGLKLVELYGSGNKRKQRILELEAYSERLESLQGQIKTRIDELRNQG